ncbi:MAG: Immunoglobulin-like protein [Candidatus Wolfebacteria bacterium GW2011_GWE2_44_13]|uniref:Immunoglobulin-like protein n=1 Tax=Candidatus Wolfebacteria bacterium GW2011_GWE2_44_13 TaxID=1619017 RepID=A0A0G1H9M6_9BACT|nr:MAG: Immunoglobulin-like protein [Candidatus Wolfebacteria bacterium GW2011_GWE2_44_13]
MKKYTISFLLVALTVTMIPVTSFAAIDWFQSPSLVYPTRPGHFINSDLLKDKASLPLDTPLTTTRVVNLLNSIPSTNGVDGVTPIISKMVGVSSATPDAVSFFRKTYGFKNNQAAYLPIEATDTEGIAYLYQPPLPAPKADTTELITATSSIRVNGKDKVVTKYYLKQTFIKNDLTKIVKKEKNLFIKYKDENNVDIIDYRNILQEITSFTYTRYTPVTEILKGDKTPTPTCVVTGYDDSGEITECTSPDVVAYVDGKTYAGYAVTGLVWKRNADKKALDPLLPFGIPFGITEAFSPTYSTVASPQAPEMTASITRPLNSDIIWRGNPNCVTDTDKDWNKTTVTIACTMRAIAADGRIGSGNFYQRESSGGFLGGWMGDIFSLSFTAGLAEIAGLPPFGGFVTGDFFSNDPFIQLAGIPRALGTVQSLYNVGGVPWTWTWTSRFNVQEDKDIPQVTLRARGQLSDLDVWVPNNAVVLDWTSQNVKPTCNVSGNWSGTRANKGTQLLGKLPRTGAKPNEAKQYTYTISCVDINSTATVSSSVSVNVWPATLKLPIPTNGSCGDSHKKVIASTPVSGLCVVGSASSVTGTDPWTWTCYGADGGSDASCEASSSNSTSTKVRIIETNPGE